ncbi:LanC-like protein 3-like protein [Diplonema papillatum]|nr:LanC-like protein 3-like protein [Diplonema papillatum]
MEQLIDMADAGYTRAYTVVGDDQVKAGPIAKALAEGISEVVTMLCSDEGLLNKNTRGNNIYTGTAGVSLALDRLLCKVGSDKVSASVLSQAEATRTRLLRELEASGSLHRLPSYLEGEAGRLSLLATVHARQGDTAKAEAATNALLSLAPDVLSMPPGECELLYGRAGYLHALHRVQPVLPPHFRARHHEIVVRVIRQVAESGTSTSHELKRSGESVPSLAFRWHDKMYFGAAHGIVGILYTLLDFPSDVLTEANAALPSALRSSVAELASCGSEDGNYPPSLGKKPRLVQFCHGATGFAMLFCKAWRVYGDETYLQAAVRASECVKRNTHSKGVGLCHGIAGNAYALLHCYAATKQARWLQHAVHLALFMCQEFRRCYQWSDRPFSLYEGIAGMLVLLADMLSDPSAAAFPGFDLC